MTGSSALHLQFFLLLCPSTVSATITALNSVAVLNHSVPSPFCSQQHNRFKSLSPSKLTASHRCVSVGVPQPSINTLQSRKSLHGSVVTPAAHVEGGAVNQHRRSSKTTASALLGIIPSIISSNVSALNSVSATKADKVTANIVTLSGDGIGPEVIAAALAVLDVVAEQRGHMFRYTELPIGGASIDASGTPLSADTLAACLRADAVLLGAVGGPKWANVAVTERPEQGLLALRKGMDVYANLRPVRVLPAQARHSPLPSLGVDFVFVRELTGGAYFGDRTETDDEATDQSKYTRAQVERVARHAFRLARTRRGRVTSVDKANVLATSRLWRRVVSEVHETEFNDVDLEHQLVDSMAMLLIKDPARYDVILTENMFGDILSDEASMLAGSLGLLPSASLGDEGRPSLYEPIHGSAPGIAGKGIANPIGTILSAAMMLRYSLGLEEEARWVEAAVDWVLNSDVETLTRDLRGHSTTATWYYAVIAALLDKVKPPSLKKE